MPTLYITREDLIADLPRTYREQNDLESMTDKQAIAAWKRFGIHAGTWDWDEVEIQRD